MYSLLKD